MTSPPQPQQRQSKNPALIASLNRWLQPSPPGETASAIAQHQLHQLYANAGSGLLASLTLATLVVVTHLPVIAPFLLLAWWSALALLTAARTFAITRYRRSRHETAADSPWFAWHFLGTAGAGLSWGAAGVLFFTPDSTEHLAFLCLAITGMIAGAVPIHAASRAAFLAFALPASLPIIAQLLIQGNRLSIAMATTGLIFLGVMSSLVWILNRGFRQTVELTIERSQAETQLFDLFARTNDLIQSVAPDGRLLFVNRAWRETLGYSATDAAAMNIFDVLHPDSREHCRTFMQRILAGEDLGPVEIMFQTKSGHIIVAEGQVNLRLEHGLPVATRGIFRNITERKLAETRLRAINQNLEHLVTDRTGKLRASEQLFRTLAQVSPVGIFHTDAAGRCLYVNERWCEITGLNAEAAAGNGWSATLHPDDRERVNREWIEAAGTGRPFKSEYRFQPTGSQVTWVVGQAQAEFDQHNRLTGYVGTVTDITDRKQAEQNLREREEYFRSLIEHSSDIITLLGPDGTIQFQSPSFHRIFGYGQQEINGRIAFEFIHPDDLPNVLERFHLILQQPLVAQSAEFRFHHKDGSWRHLEGVGQLIHPPQGQTAVIVNSRDITERKLAERTMREQAALLDRIFTHSLDCLILLDKDYNFIRVSESYARVCQRPASEFPGHNHFALYPSSLKEEFDEAVQQGITYHRQARPFSFPDHPEWGVTYWDLGLVPIRDVEGNIEFFLFTLQDVTERERAEEALKESLQFLQSIIQTTPTRVFWKDRHSRYLGGNQQFADDAGVASPQDLIGKDDSQLPWHLQADLYRADDRQVMESGISKLGFEEQQTTPDGRSLWLRTSKVPLRNNAQEVIGILGIYDDITERKETDFALQQSIERFNLAVQASRDGLWDIYLIANDPFNDENPIYYSPRMKEIMGIATTTGPNRLGEWSALIHPDDRERIFAALTAHLTQRTPYDIEYRIITNSGDSKWIAAKGQAQWSASGIPIRMSGSFSDITARMHAEEQLRLTQVTMDRLSEAIFWIDRSANICYVNESACRMLGYSQEELLALSVPDIDPHFPADAWPSHWAELRQRGNFTFESTHRTKSGSLFQTEVTVNYLEFQGKEFNCAIMRDVTERKRAEQALQDNRELLNSILDSTPSAVFALDRQQRFTLLNNVTAQILDLSKDEILGKTLYDVLPQDLANRLQLANSHILASGTSQFTEEFFSGKDTHLPRHVLSSKFPLRDAQGNIVGLGNVSTDVTEYKQAERALAESEERFRILFEQAAVGVAQIDAATGRFVRVNRKFCDITGYSQAKMLTFDTRELTHQDDWEVLQQHLRQLMSGDVREFMLEQRFLCINGTVAWVKLVVSPMWQPGATPDFVIVVAQDITERKQAEESLQIFQEQIRQMQKQEALGQLAGGIAHDFNNLLTAILGNAEIVGRKLATDHPSRPNLSRILEAGNRASQLVQQILTFTRQQEVTRTAQSLAPIITEALGLLRATIPASVALTSTVDIATPSVMADATQLHQVIMNLCTNAWHAMKDRHGSIMINLAPITLTEPLHSLQTTLPPGTYAHLSVGDTGCGIEADILERIFDPFFTTKPVGQGTGLGLSVVQGIIQGHDGAIVVESQPGRGTTFHLYFPAASTGEPANAPHTSTASPLEGQGRHLLYVDDEAMLVELIAARFEPLGYRVTGLTSATKALETIRAHPQDVDVVVTDYNMPEMSGLEIAQAVAAIRADLPVVLVSGYLSPEAQAAALAAEIKGIVYKPTMLQQLGDVVAKLFDSPPPTR